MDSSLTSSYTFKFKVGDRALVLPPAGINDTEVHRAQYEQAYKGKPFEVVSVRARSVLIGGREQEAEEVGLRMPNPNFNLLAKPDYRFSSISFDDYNASKEYVTRYFFVWSLKPYGALEEIFNWLDTHEARGV